MPILLAGLMVFLGAHSVRILADDWRTATVARMGLNNYRRIYSLVSAAGLALVIWGYVLTRQHPVFLWHPPLWTAHLAALLMLPSFILLTAGNMPRNHFTAKLGHPMVLGVKLWAFAHLLANGRLGDVVLFAAFLVWAVADYASARRRDRRAAAADALSAATRGQPSLSRTVLVIVAGTVVYIVFGLWLHRWLIGVAPWGSL